MDKDKEEVKQLKNVETGTLKDYDNELRVEKTLLTISPQELNKRLVVCETKILKQEKDLLQVLDFIAEICKLNKLKKI